MLWIIQIFFSSTCRAFHFSVYSSTSGMYISYYINLWNKINFFFFRVCFYVFPSMALLIRISSSRYLIIYISIILFRFVSLSFHMSGSLSIYLYMYLIISFSLSLSVYSDKFFVNSFVSAHHVLDCLLVSSTRCIAGNHSCVRLFFIKTSLPPPPRILLANKPSLSTSLFSPLRLLH